MEITHLGHSSFKIRGKTATLITDPFDPAMLGLKFPKAEADIVTISHEHPDHNNSEIVGGNPVLVSGPGEYEIKKVKIIGVGVFHDKEFGEKRGTNTIYHIDMDGISIVHTGDLGHELGEKEIELLDGVDILLVSVGGVFTIDASEAVKLVSKLEPKIIIPMHYREIKGDAKFYQNLSPVEDFLTQMGKTGIGSVTKLVVTKDKLPAEQTVVVLDS